MPRGRVAAECDLSCWVRPRSGVDTLLPEVSMAAVGRSALTPALAGDGGGAGGGVLEDSFALGDGPSSVGMRSGPNERWKAHCWGMVGVGVGFPWTGGEMQIPIPRNIISFW